MSFFPRVTFQLEILRKSAFNNTHASLFNRVSQSQLFAAGEYLYTFFIATSADYEKTN